MFAICTIYVNYDFYVEQRKQNPALIYPQHFRFKQITNLPTDMKGEWFSKKDLANIALPKPISDKLLQDG